MYHVALNRTRSNNRHFNYDIVKTFRFHPRQRRHLGAAFDLENTNGVSPLHNLEGRRIIFRNVSQVEWPPAFTTQLKCVLHHRHHTEA